LSLTHIRQSIILASVAALVGIFVSCKGETPEAERLDLSSTPLQTVTDMFGVQTRNGKVEMRLEAPLMERYDTDSLSRDVFPSGVSVYGYSEDGLLESIIVADIARHIVPKNKAGGSSEESNNEIWEAFGNVVLHNVLKQETMETDTIYWDRTKQEVYTDCYVKLYSPDGFTQGYGMRSDDHMRNSKLFNTFDSYAVVVRDTTVIVVDSVNFIGPFQKK